MEKNMKNITFLLALSLMLLPSIIIAQDEYKYEPVPNKAEYYVDKLKPGKDFEDLLKWGEQLVEWTSDHSIYDNWQPVVFMPYFNSNLQSHDSVFLGLWPNATEQYAGLDYWVKNGTSLLAKAPTIPVNALDTWQWPISSPEGDLSVGAVRFADCKMKDGVTGRQLFDAYKDFAIAARSVGDNLGRKMIFPGSGSVEGEYDYVYSLYAQNVADLGAASDNYWAKINGSDEDKALGELIESCSNSRTYITHQLK
jgi:hypothetical protein|tara:strand:+ start:22195 stop:22953 length:759 start_codon:yes stop_codon:yes gene_type:complete